ARRTDEPFPLRRFRGRRNPAGSILENESIVPQRSQRRYRLPRAATRIHREGSRVYALGRCGHEGANLPRAAHRFLPARPRGDRGRDERRPRIDGYRSGPGSPGIRPSKRNTFQHQRHDRLQRGVQGRRSDLLSTQRNLRRNPQKVKPDWLEKLFPYEQRTLVVNGRRMSYIDEGDRKARPVLLLSGNPTWGFLYRDF